MKKIAFLTLTFVFYLGFTACNNSSNNSSEHSDMQHDSTATTDSVVNESGINNAMDKMMKDMHQMTMTGNVDADFAMMMKSHHQGAVDMAKVELDFGTNERLKSLAQTMVDMQNAEIKELDKFLDNHKNPAKDYDMDNKNDGFGKVMDKNMKMMMDMPKASNESTDMQFVNMMIPHHQSAIYMAEGFLKSGKDATLMTMAQKMIEDQNKEINEMKSIKSTLK